MGRPADGQFPGDYYLEELRHKICSIPNFLNQADDLEQHWAIELNSDNIMLIDKPSKELQLQVIRKDPYNIIYIENRSEDAEIEFVKNLYYNDGANDDDLFVDKIIKSKKAKDLYCKLKKVSQIIK
jgi:hypothetical protein